MHPAHSHRPTRSPRNTPPPTPMTTQPPSRPAPSRVIFHHDVARVRRGPGRWCCKGAWDGWGGVTVATVWYAVICVLRCCIVASPRCAGARPHAPHGHTRCFPPQAAMAHASERHDHDVVPLSTVSPPGVLAFFLPT